MFIQALVSCTLSKPESTENICIMSTNPSISSLNIHISIFVNATYVLYCKFVKMKSLKQKSEYSILNDKHEHWLSVCTWHCIDVSDRKSTNDWQSKDSCLQGSTYTVYSYREVNIKYEFNWGRRVMAGLRMGCFPLAVETGRYSSNPYEERVCRLCDWRDVEDQSHFLCIRHTCPV